MARLRQRLGAARGRESGGLTVAKFLTRLRVEELEDASADGRGTWQLLTTLAYKSDVADTVFIVPTGFITDFASVPRIPIAYMLTGGTAHAAAVVHDFLYTTHEVTRAMADAVFREAIIASGGARWRAWMMWAGVRVGGGSSWDAPGQNPDPGD